MPPNSGWAHLSVMVPATGVGTGGLVTRSLRATVGAFTARTKTGNIRPTYSHIIAITAGTLVASRWRSDPKTGGGLARALVFGVADKVQDDLLREFAPELGQFGHGIWRKVPNTFRRPFDMGR